MRISLVVAASTNNVIGRNGELPWRISDDLKHFKAVTMGHPIVMGRRTFESIGRPLPGRTNIVLTTQRDYAADGCKVVHSPAAALRAAETADEIMVIGGGEVYALFLPMAARVHLTRVDATIEGDAYFPELLPNEWQLIEDDARPRGENDFAFSFQVFERVAGPSPANA